MRKQQRGCFLGSGCVPENGGYQTTLRSFLKKNPVITDHCAASQACSFGENHLTGDKLDCFFGARGICNRPSKTKSTFCSSYLKDTDKIRHGGDKKAFKQVESNKTHILDMYVFKGNLLMTD